MLNPKTLQRLQQGVAIPAHPLALDRNHRLDERRQRALSRYYLSSGAGGLAVGVHTTQFAIREPRHGLYEPVLTLAAEEMQRADLNDQHPVLRVAGLCGPTRQAIGEATLARDLGYHTGLLSLAALTDASQDATLDHCRAVAEVLPLFGFYLQPGVGGRLLSYRFWRRFCEIPQVVAIKIAPFNRYHTLDVIRAVVDSGRDDIGLYTGNDDNLVADLLTPYAFTRQHQPVQRRIVGGLLGHWSVWTRTAVQLLKRIQAACQVGTPIDPLLLQLGVEVTDCNAALFDVANHFRGCIPGLHEVLRRQGLLEGIWCLNPDEGLSPGQAAEIDRVSAAYPHLQDDPFVQEHLDQWLSG
jgi:hypothetical protein